MASRDTALKSVIAQKPVENFINNSLDYSALMFLLHSKLNCGQN